ncbi:MAG: hypothetical protein K8R68_06855, partial [Bacteroidales bacterium]|nr:hypothetical protein [Bacteroidales bacterium]
NSFDSNTNSIFLGEDITLKWNVDDASSISITEVGKVALTGDRVLSPIKNTTYTLKARSFLSLPRVATTDVNVIQPKIEIKFPENNDKLLLHNGSNITIKGTTSHDLSSRDLWVIVQNPNGDYYPFPKAALIKNNNNWETTLYQLGNAEDAGKTFILGVYLLNGSAFNEIIEYVESTENGGNYGIPHLPKGATSYHKVEIIGVV